jgi:hypothetical protein
VEGKKMLKSCGLTGFAAAMAGQFPKDTPKIEQLWPNWE